jgi:NAD(P)-dependent dehydrogenase (short-subunit alcohol dehydrogenase family)
LTGAISLIAPVLLSPLSEHRLSLQESFTAIAGKTVVITGASDGIGRVASLTLTAAGAHVVMVGRNAAKTVAAAQRIMSATGSRTVTAEIADLSRRDAVLELADGVLRKHEQIAVLINNAGALFLDRQITPDGFERTFALNHLAYFALSVQLLPALARAGTARIINVSSRAHRRARLDVDDVVAPASYRSWRAYANSKLANILFTKVMAHQLDPARISVHAVHPGLVSTRFAANNGMRGRLIRRIMDLRAISPEQGADSLVWLATANAGDLGSGEYFVRRQRVTPSRAARNTALADALWTVSERCTQLNAHTMIAHTGVGRAS